MKFVLLNDTHHGVRNAADVLLDSAEVFYRDILFPYMEKNGITTILHLGDFYDNRKVGSYKVFNRVRKIFLDELVARGIHMHIVPGNHDVFFKNTNEINSLKETLGYFKKNITIHMNPTELNLDGVKVGMVPWITSDNLTICEDFIQRTEASILCGHFDIVGFEMYKGQPPSTEGYTPEVFERFEFVMSGHYHTKSTIGNIHYLGSQMEFTWADAGDQKYFHEFDTETRELKAVPNTHSIFDRIVYDDTGSTRDVNWLSSKDFSKVTGHFVKVIVLNKSNPIMFDRFMQKLHQSSPFDVKVAETFQDGLLGDSPSSDVLEDTGTLIASCIDNITTDLDKDTIKRKLLEFYVEAQSLEIA